MSGGTATWRPMRADDLPAVAAMSDAVHGAFTEPLATYAERLALYPQGCHILESRGFEGEGTAIGYLVTHPWRLGAPPKLGAALGALPADPDSYYLHDIALLPAARGQRAGEAAVALVLNLARAAGLPVIELVAVGGADAYWQRLGFAYAAPGADGPYGPGTFVMRRPVDA
ncbi:MULTISPECIES: GNAT family N-acetyltransferase [Sphingopyxis]|jgi:ribosomal protein S18 acetylase RimI-like enzyme|uniref:GNAT family N-acetyltransferase n=1 Tax=Sphingopyxis TaxID=165697 RepID=UPI00086982A2|nr:MULTISPECIES: GNAT family N-acetyltransferase [Sphingopyxis]APW72070.1 GNAT family N-acetyltransferase [Sphingopyxis granuli]AVA12823.1 N-acetyltransferase [Sphingopyxis sp. MG]ODU29439.1 MAG: GNAT family N-acetyltransferase [Sphingopyxis sp. SCN 67-31]